MHGRNAGGLGPACLLRAMMHYCDYILTQLPKQTKHFQGVCYGTVLETGRLFNGIGHNREGGPRIWMSTAASLSCFLNLLTTVDGIQLCFPPTTPRPHWGAWRGGGGVWFSPTTGCHHRHSETDEGAYILRYKSQSHTAFKYPTFKSKPNLFLHISRSNPHIGLLYLICAKFSTITTI